MSDVTDTTKEVWKTIEEFPNYSISSFGRVRKDAKPIQTKGGILNPRPNKKGYFVVRLIKNGKRHGLKVSRLVAISFLSPDPSRPEVNHKNLNKSDNSVGNLEWSTRLENMRHAYESLPPWNEKGSERYCAKLTEDQIPKIRDMLDSGSSQKMVGELYGITQSAVSRIKLRLTWKHVK